MYFTEHTTMTPGTWMTQNLDEAPAPTSERIVLFKTSGAPPRRVRIRRAGPGAHGHRACASHR